MSRHLLFAPNIAGHPESTGILMSSGRIEAIGRIEALAAIEADKTVFADATIMAPLHDHHFHPIGYAAVVTGLSLNTVADLAELADRLREAASRLPKGAALIGNRLDDERLAEARLPNRAELDAAVADRAVLLYRYCGHVAVANTAALELAGLASHPSGIIKEADIQFMSSAVGSQRPPLQHVDVHRALEGLASLGLGTLTAIVSAAEPLWCGTPDEVGTLIDVASSLPLEFNVLVAADTPGDLELAASRLDHGPTNLKFLGWKGFADGSLGGHTAALSSPYTDDPTTAGLLRLDPANAFEMARTSLNLGGLVAIHAIGDLANERVMDLFEVLIHRGVDPAGLRIEHASVLSPTLIDRMARLGITASVQPPFITSEAAWLGKRLGTRTEHTYQLAALNSAAVPMVGGSDCPVEAPNPWWGVAAAAGAGGLGPDLALDLYRPTLQVGGPADLIVVDADPIGRARIEDTRLITSYRKGQRFIPAPELPFV
ncbi:MAG: amidohydrolase [Actinomycetota bacterium]